MKLDLVTLFWVLNLCYLVNFIFAIVLYLGGSIFPGARLWILAQVLVALGSLIFTQRESLPYFLISLGNTLLLSALLVYAHSAWIFRWGKTYPRGLYGIILLFFLGFLLLENSTVSSRTILFSVVNVVACLFVFLIFIFKAQSNYRYASWMAGFPFLLIGVGYFIQMASTLATAPAYSVNQLNPSYAIIILFSIVTASISLFGYFLLAGTFKQRNIEAQAAKLAETNLELRKTSHTKDLFVSMMAHDLRAPISGAARYVRKNLLPSDIDLEEKRQSLEILAVSLEKTHSFLENVLWWSKSQREDIILTIRRFDLAEVASNVVEMLKPMAEGKDIELALDSKEGPVDADFDSTMLIVHNLVSNAIKFSDAGSSVQIGLGLTPGKHTFLRVTDQGVGIPFEIRERLFQIESKVSTAGTAGEIGNGMGLILCWEFAKLNKARLILTSEPGIGTNVMLLFD